MYHAPCRRYEIRSFVNHQRYPGIARHTSREKVIRAKEDNVLPWLADKKSVGRRSAAFASCDGDECVKSRGAAFIVPFASGLGHSSLRGRLVFAGGISSGKPAE